MTTFDFERRDYSAHHSSADGVAKLQKRTRKVVNICPTN